MGNAWIEDEDGKEEDRGSRMGHDESYEQCRGPEAPSGFLLLPRRENQEEEHEPDGLGRDVVLGPDREQRGGDRRLSGDLRPERRSEELEDCEERDSPRHERIEP